MHAYCCGVNLYDKNDCKATYICVAYLGIPTCKAAEQIITVGNQTFTDQLARRLPNYLLNQSRPLSTKKDRHTLIEQPATLIEQPATLIEQSATLIEQLKTF